MSTNAPTATPTAAPCAQCGSTGGTRNSRTNPRPWRGHGLCLGCYTALHNHGTFDRVPQTFEGVPDDYTPPPTGWPVVPALVAPLHPTPMPRDRWAQAAWVWSPDDPRLVGCLSEMLMDRDADQEAA